MSALHPVDEGELVGRSVKRREDAYLLRGRGQFLDDIPTPRDTVYVGFVPSPHAHARIVSVDTAEAAMLEGVVAVLTGEDMARLVLPLDSETRIDGYVNSVRHAVAVGRVRYVGESVAVVVAEDPYVVQDAMALVAVDYDVLDAVADMDRALQPDAPAVHDHIPGNVSFEGTFSTPDFDEAFAGAPLVLKERFQTGWVGGVPLEPRGCLATPDHTGDSVTLYTSTQIPHIVRTGIAGLVSMPESKLRVVVPEVGGGFGTKANIYPEEPVVVALARHLGRAVKWVQDRSEELLNNIHSRNHVYDLDVAYDRDGVIHAVRLDMLANAGAYTCFPFGTTLEATGGARMLPGPYRIRNYAYKTRSVMTNTGPAGAYRGVSQPTCFFAIEGVMDRIGRKLGISPAEVRRRNLIRDDEFPWNNAVGVRYDTGSYHACLERALEMADYDRLQARSGRLDPDGKYRGVGICNFTESTGTGVRGWRARGLSRLPGYDSATIRVEPTGGVSAFISQASAGQGHLTTFAQLVADQVGVRMEDVTVVEGDTALVPYGTNTVASRSAITAGGAVIRAGAKVAEKLRRLAAFSLGVSPSDIVLRNGVAWVADEPETRVSIETLARTAYAIGHQSLPQGEEYGLEATDIYDPPMVTIANAVHIARVAVDPQDGRVAVEDYVVVHDCGRVINPMIVEGQIHGGVAQGIGEALMEEFVYDSSGQMLNANLLEYMLPTSLDIPDIRIDHIETPTIDAVGGFKGVGESGVIGAVPAIANAVADALSQIGANLNQIPLRPAVVYSLIRQANGE